jgi:hypothetical protein
MSVGTSIAMVPSYLVMAAEVAVKQCWLPKWLRALRAVRAQSHWVSVTFQGSQWLWAVRAQWSIDCVASTFVFKMLSTSRDSEGHGKTCLKGLDALWVKHSFVWTSRFPWLIAVEEDGKVKSLGCTICCNAPESQRAAPWPSLFKVDSTRWSVARGLGEDGNRRKPKETLWLKQRRCKSVAKISKLHNKH